MLLISLVSLAVNLLIILAVIAFFYLIIYLFEKWVLKRPIDSTIKGVVLFIVFAVMVIYLLTGHGFVTF